MNPIEVTSQNRKGFTIKQKIAQYELYVIVTFLPEYADHPVELFLKVAKEGSTLRGLVDALGLTASLALRHHCSWQTISAKWKELRYDPTDDKYNSITHAIAEAVDQAIELRRGYLAGES